MRYFFSQLLLSTLILASPHSHPPHHGRTNIILSNDDGWAELNIRTFFSALTSPPFSYNVVLSAPSENKSGTGSTDVPPTVLNTTCEFDTCPIGSPPEGFNASDPRFNYVNSFPVPSMRFGIKELAPKFFGGPPVIAVAGPNVGLNTGQTTLISGTVGATTEASLEGIPAIAFSGASGSQVSYTSPISNNTYSPIYASLSTVLTHTLLSGASQFPHEPILPNKIWLNVNFSPSNSTICNSVKEFKFIFTRINTANETDGVDLDICGNGGRLPTENSVLGTSGGGCFATVSVGNATDKADVNSGIQKFAFERLKSVLSCLS